MLSNAPFNLDWSEGTLDAPGLSALDLTGTTQIRLGFELDDNDDQNRDYVGYYSGDESDPANRPQLVVEYLD